MARKSFFGAEVKNFWDAWPPGPDWYVDDGSEDVMALMDGDGPGDTDKIADWSLGYLGWQGTGDEPETGPYHSGLEVSVILKRWLRDQKELFITVRVPRDQEATFRECINAHGWRIAK